MVFPEDKKTIGQRIRWLREQQGMSQRGFARELGISSPFLFDIEHDRRKTTKLNKICELLGVELDELETPQ